MTKEELLKVGKFLEVIVKREVTSATKPLLKEIKVLKESLEDQKAMFGQMLVESMQAAPLQQSAAQSVAPTPPPKNVYAQSQPESGKSELFSILAETTPLAPEGEAVSILDIPKEHLAEANSPGAQLMANILDPDKLQKTLKHVMKPQGGVRNPIDV